MKKLPILFFAFILLSNCNSAEKKAKEKNIIKANLTADSTLFTLKEDGYEAKLSTDSQNRRAKADGNTIFQRIGSFSYIISELYQKPTKVLKSPYSRTHYELDIKWSDEISFDIVRKKVLKKMQEEFEYSVEKGMFEQQTIILYKDDNARLQKAKHSTNSDALYKSSLEDGVWKIQATLEEFANELGDFSDQEIVIQEDTSNTIYNFTLSTNRGFSSILKQLQEVYGITSEENTVQVEHYVISFKNS
ncbi:hypothetical protein [Gracilimonas halophila]|uniref:Lipoprotein n=1 Tax=Gracilimonas halophila TaxID=1834464 RepID=A0ABW5JIC4_9BACT